jgi:hypothetical protein
MADLLFVPDRRVAHRLACSFVPFAVWVVTLPFLVTAFTTVRTSFPPLYDGGDCVCVHALGRYGIRPKWRNTRNW